MNVRLGDSAFHVYIATNAKKTILRVNATGDLQSRLAEWEYESRRIGTQGLADVCSKLLHVEVFNNPDKALKREKELNSWSRKKKVALIEQFNPKWNVLNEKFTDF